MSKKTLFAVLAAALCFSVPAAVPALYGDRGKTLFCDDDKNPVCRLYQVCRPILENYPEAEITEKGKDCTLTVEARQFIIRRKRTKDEVGYFYFMKRLDAQSATSHP